MKRLLSILLSVFSLTSFGQTTPFTLTTIPYVQPDYVYTPGRGANEWSYGQNIVNIPVQGTNTPRNDRYWRFTWLDFQSAGGSAGVYSFAAFDAKIQESITKGQKFSFGIMQQCTSCDANLQNPVTSGGVTYTNLLPNWLITAMPNSYGFQGDWYPDYNSAAYLNAVKNLSIALNAHILAGSFNGVQYKNVINFIDIRGYGNFGEWTNNDFSQITPTVASLDSIISYQGNVFTTFQCVVMIGAFSGGQLPNVNVPPAVGYYALTTKNSYGVFGWRRDNWGQTDNYIRMFLDLNPTVFNGLSFKDTIMTRHQFAPVCGEPQDCGSAGNFPDLITEIVRYGGSSFGNGNFNCAVNATIQNNFRAASLAAGYRILPTAGNMTTNLVTNGAFTITTTWQNVGVAPTYENWNTQFELRTGTTVVWTGTSSRVMRLFQPGAGVVTIDNFNLGAVAPGIYGLYVIIRDPLGFRQPLPIAITGRNSDGSYLLRGGITVTSSGAPVANAGANQAITLPTNTVNVSGSGSSGTITSYSWTRISGPNSPTIATPTTVTTAINGMIAGTYLFQLAINGGISTSQVQITVSSAPAPATTIFTTQNPPATSLNDGVAIELGVKFQSSIPGYITGIRFWKGSTPTNTGTHIGELYNAAGTRLAQATFTGETASGWQTVTFSSPVQITAGTTYIAAYWSGNGFYTASNNYFTAATVNGTLTALAATAGSPNGVYQYSATPAFPTSTFQSSNYWVDVTFSSVSPQPPYQRRGRKGLPKLLITLP